MTTPDDAIKQALASNGYRLIRKLPDGRWIALYGMLYTTGLFVLPPDGSSWTTRYCYENDRDATEDVASWDGTGDPPGRWIKQKPEERLNPLWLKEGV